jgi:hypothetical protein
MDIPLTPNDLIRIHIETEYIGNAAHTAYWMAGNNEHLHKYHVDDALKHYAKLKSIFDNAENRTEDLRKSQIGEE